MMQISIMIKCFLGWS